MDDLISRQAVIDAVRQFYDEFSDNEKSIEEIIAELPSADAVEVVRCKDCKHFHRDTWGYEIGFERGHILYNLIVGHETCDRWSKGHNQVCEDGYCFLAERREDEN